MTSFNIHNIYNFLQTHAEERLQIIPRLTGSRDAALTQGDTRWTANSTHSLCPQSSSKSWTAAILHSTSNTVQSGSTPTIFTV
jgi:hypothetical protein